MILYILLNLFKKKLILQKVNNKTFTHMIVSEKGQLYYKYYCLIGESSFVVYLTLSSLRNLSMNMQYPRKSNKLNFNRWRKYNA